MSFTNSKRIFLVDCNNFYVSCERVFNPKLHKKPVVILSSNDGCIVARSNEAKALEIPMGAPAFQYAHIFKRYNVIVQSSNFALYADMSCRVMQTLAQEAAEIEVYSVDEAFLYMPDYGQENNPAYYAACAQRLVRKIKKHTGIPVSIGIACTKTLAKIANKMAKKNPAYNGYYDLSECPDMGAVLEHVPVGDVWGIGRRYNRFLLGKGITTARALRDCPDAWVRKNLTVSGLRTVQELRGTPCFEFGQSNDAKKSITVSRSFGKPITQCGMLKQAVARYTITAALKLREEQRLTDTITIFVIVSQPHDSQRRYESACVQLPSATFYTADFITAAKLAVDRIFKPGLIYRKAGVILTDLIPEEFMQLQWHTKQVDSAKQKSVIAVVDAANSKWGKDTLSFAAAGTTQPWKTKAEKKSANFTTSWQELLTIKV